MHSHVSPLRLLAVAALTVLLGVPGSSVAAPDDEDDDASNNITWQVQPLSIDDTGQRPYFVYDAEPGTAVEDTVTITNLSSEPLNLAVFGSDALNTSEGLFDILATAEEPTDVGSWVSLASDNADGTAGTVTVQPSETIEVPFRIDIPANATPGDHVGGVVTSLVTEQANEDGEVIRFDSRVAARIYLSVAGELAPTLQVSDLTTTYSGSFMRPWTGELTATWTVQNTGNIRLSGAQNVSISGMGGWGSATQSIELPEILPGNSITQSAIFSGVPAAVRLSAEVVVQPTDPSGRLVDPIVPVASSSSLWAVPWLFGVIAAVAIAIAWVLLQRRRRQRAVLAALRQELDETRRAEPATTTADS